MPLAVIIEDRSWLEKHGNPLVLALGPGTDPMAAEFVIAIDNPAFCRIGDVKLPPVPNLVQHHEMVLVPVKDTGQGCLSQHFGRDASANGMQPESLRGLADA